MAYIGNAKTPLILSTNVRDDLLPDGVKNTFELSQEVPGGDENNVIVLRQKFVDDVLVDATDLIVLENNQIVITDNYLAAAFSVVQPGDLLVLEYNDGSSNITEIKHVTSNGVLYNRDQITITVDTNFTNNVPAATHSIKVRRGYHSFWELLDTTEYTIKGDFGTNLYHRQIELEQTPKSGDKIFVLHRGDATYNFVPSPGSVGVDQLSSNLRTFVCDRFTANGSTDTFTISQTVVDPKSLLVTVNGNISESDDLAQGIQGDWELLENPTTKQQQIKFHTPPNNENKIRVLHLGFVSGQRRALFAPGQELLDVPQNSVGAGELKNSGVTNTKISDGAVTTSKIAANTVDGSKILLDGSTNDSIRISFGEGQIQTLLGYGTAGTQLLANGNLSVFDYSSGTSQKFLTLSPTGIEPKTSSQNIGTSDNKFQSMHLSGIAFVGGLMVNGEATVTTNAQVGANLFVQGDAHLHNNAQIDGSLSAGASTISGNITLSHLPSPAPKFTVDGVVLSDLKTAFDLLVNKVNNLVPIGSMMIWSSETLPDSNWRICDGSELNISEYAELYQRIQFSFGGSIASGKFNLPDLRSRVPVGTGNFGVAVSEGLGIGDRNMSHDHTGADHTHSIPAHNHGIPAHSHSIVPTKSTLKITSSGAHSTDFTHGHITDTSSVNLAHTHNIDHGHSGTATATDVPHSHSVNIVSDPTTVTVAMRAIVEANSTTNSAIDQNVYSSYIAVSASGDGDANKQRMRFGYSPSHTHRVQGSTAQSSTNSLSHTHPVTIPTSSGLNTGAASTSLDHKHSVNIPSTSFVSNSSGGTHVHGEGSFDGSIGDATKPNGSLDATLYSEMSPVSPTGPANYGTPPNKTGTATVPHLVVNFIIKVKNN